MSKPSVAGKEVIAIFANPKRTLPFTPTSSFGIRKSFCDQPKANSLNALISVPNPPRFKVSPSLNPCTGRAKISPG